MSTCTFAKNGKAESAGVPGSWSFGASSGTLKWLTDKFPKTSSGALPGDVPTSAFASSTGYHVKPEQARALAEAVRATCTDKELNEHPAEGFLSFNETAAKGEGYFVL